MCRVGVGSGWRWPCLWRSWPARRSGRSRWTRRPRDGSACRTRRRSRSCPRGWGARCCRWPTAGSAPGGRSCGPRGRSRTRCRRERGVVHGPVTFAPGESGQAGAPHQRLDRAVADQDAVAEAEFGVDASHAVGAEGRGVDGLDLLGEPGVAQGPWGDRAGAPLVVAGLGDSEEPAGELDGKSFRGHHRDRLEPPFGVTTWLMLTPASRTRR